MLSRVVDSDLERVRTDRREPELDGDGFCGDVEPCLVLPFACVSALIESRSPKRNARPRPSIKPAAAPVPAITLRDKDDAESGGCASEIVVAFTVARLPSCSVSRARSKAV